MHIFNSVSELNNYSQNVLTADDWLSSLSVVGEISGFDVNRASGHAYFKIKDQNSQIQCVMFSNYLSRLNFVPQDGMKVRLTGSVGLYIPYGTYQIRVTTMERQGKGDLLEQLRRLYQRLNAEGLFSPEHKVAIPQLPKRIGVISSDTGDVIYDIITTLRRRNPHFDILLYPVHVQGAECPADVVNALDYFEQRQNVDVIIIARGGGSVEDLFGFNDEAIVRAVYNSSIPVISAIGHESDHTLCDLVADLRAPTPTAAAELVLTAFADFENDIANKKIYLDMAINSFLDANKRRLDYLVHHEALHSPKYAVDVQRSKLQSLIGQLSLKGNELTSRESTRIERLATSLNNSMDQRMLGYNSRLSSYIDKLEALGPTSVLKRGFSYVNDGTNPITSVSKLKKGDKINIVFIDGKADASITDIKTED